MPVGVRLHVIVGDWPSTVGCAARRAAAGVRWMDEVSPCHSWHVVITRGCAGRWFGLSGGGNRMDCKGQPHYPIEIHLVRLLAPPVHAYVVDHVAGARKREFTVWAHEAPTIVEDGLVSLHVPSSGVYPVTLVTLVDLFVSLQFVCYRYLVTVRHGVCGLRRVL